MHLNLLSKIFIYKTLLLMVNMRKLYVLAVWPEPYPTVEWKELQEIRPNIKIVTEIEDIIWLISFFAISYTKQLMVNDIHPPIIVLNNNQIEYAKITEHILVELSRLLYK